MPQRDYGARGRVGVAPPQANPTVEPEILACLPPGVSMLTTRLTSASADPKTRMLEYFDRFDQTLQSYDALKLDAVAFACTASSYLVGHEREDRDIAALSQKRGYPIITGGKAIIAGLRKIGARDIVIGAPYPAWALEACRAYYEAAGFTVRDMRHIDIGSTDLRAIYELSSAKAIAAAASFDLAGVDCVLFTGSGMPSLRAVQHVERTTGLPSLCTNLCLGWSLCEVLGLANWGTGSHRLLNGWQERLDTL